MTQLSKSLRSAILAAAVLTVCAQSAVAAQPQEEARALFERFVKAQNAHDLDAVQRMLWNSPQFLWISRGNQIRGVSAAMEVYRTYYQGTWHLEPDFSQLQTTVISHDVVQVLVPVTFTRGLPGQPSQDATFLISQTQVHDRTGWHITTIIPVANTQLKK